MYIVRYTCGNHVLRLRLRVAVKLNFRPYFRRYTSPNKIFEYSYPLFDCSNDKLTKKTFWHDHKSQAFLDLLSCQPRVAVTSCFVYKVIRDLESIDHLCINPIHRIMNLQFSKFISNQPVFRKIEVTGPLVEPLKPLETFNLVAIL